MEEERKREFITYTPGFRWVEFRRSYNQTVRESMAVTEAVINYLMWKSVQEQEGGK